MYIKNAAVKRILLYLNSLGLGLKIIGIPIYLSAVSDLLLCAAYSNNTEAGKVNIKGNWFFTNLGTFL